MPRRFWLFSLLALVCANGLAEPRITIETRYYPVTGNTLAEIYQSLQRNGPTGEQGRTFHAHTEWNIEWGYRWIESNDNCRLTDIDVTITIGYLLPQLDSPELLDDSILTSWQRYYQALLNHEEHHKDYGIKAAHELDNALRAKPVQDCLGLENRLSKLARGIIEKYDAMEKAYDRETNHGTKEGVVLQ